MDDLALPIKFAQNELSPGHLALNLVYKYEIAMYTERKEEYYAITYIKLLAISLLRSLIGYNVVMIFKLTILYPNQKHPSCKKSCSQELKNYHPQKDVISQNGWTRGQWSVASD